MCIQVQVTKNPSTISEKKLSNIIISTNSSKLEQSTILNPKN